MDDGGCEDVVQQKVYQYVDMMETLLTNDDVKLLMRTLMLNTQVIHARVLQMDAATREQLVRNPTSQLLHR